MKGNHRELESEARDNQSQARQNEPAVEVRTRQPDYDLPKLHGAESAIDKCHSEQEEGGGSRSQHEVLNAGFER